MRVAYVFDQILPSTSTDTEQAANTITAMQRAGAEVEWVLPAPWWGDAPGAEVLQNYYQVDNTLSLTRLRSIFPFPVRPMEKAAHAMRAAVERQLSRYDVIYTRNIPTLLCSLAVGRRVVYETYRPWPAQHPALTPLFRVAMGRRNFLGGIFHSDYARRCYVDSGIDASRLEVVHNGFDPARFTPPRTREEARAELGLPITGTCVTYTGRVNMKKGLGIMLELARRLPDVTFLIVGSEGEGEVEREARGLKNVIVEGWKTFDELPVYLFASDVLLVPPTLGPLSRVGNTVLPMKLFLYLAAGRAILAPDAPDTAELLSHDDNAWLVRPDDTDAAEAAIRMFAETPERAEALAERSRALSETLTWDARGCAIVSHLERWLKR